MKITPFNNMVVAKLAEKEKKAGSVFIPDQSGDRFVKLEVLAVGNLVDWIKVGDIVWANNLFEILDPKEKVGFVNSKDILGRIE